MNNGEITTIKLTTKTRDRLLSFGKKGQTYDELLNQILDFVCGELVDGKQL